jgi:hypothetical protein
MRWKPYGAAERPDLRSDVRRAELNSTTTGYTALERTNSPASCRRLAPPPSPVRHAVRARRLRQHRHFINSKQGAVRLRASCGTGASQPGRQNSPQWLRPAGQRPDHRRAGDSHALRCFPEDYLVANPQFATANYNANTGSSNYHSMESPDLHATHSRHIVTATYTWAKSMELRERLDGSVNRDADYRLASNHRGQRIPHERDDSNCP